MRANRSRSLSVRRLVRLSLASAIAVWLPAAASAVREDGQLWTGISGSVGLTERIRAGLMVQTRLRRDMSTLERVLVRPSVTARLEEWVSVGAGYDAHVIESPLDLVEHRVWQQAAFSTPVRGVGITNRLRLEERFGDPIDGVSVRLRYLLGLRSPALVAGIRGILRNELFLNFDEKGPTARTGLGENPTFAGLQRALSDQWSIEVGYQAQLIRFRLDRELLNHTLVVGVAARY